MSDPKDKRAPGDAGAPSANNLTAAPGDEVKGERILYYRNNSSMTHTVGDDQHSVEFAPGAELPASAFTSRDLERLGDLQHLYGPFEKKSQEVG